MDLAIAAHCQERAWSYGCLSSGAQELQRHDRAAMQWPTVACQREEATVITGQLCRRYVDEWLWAVVGYCDKERRIAGQKCWDGEAATKAESRLLGRGDVFQFWFLFSPSLSNFPFFPFDLCLLLLTIALWIYYWGYWLRLVHIGVFVVVMRCLLVVVIWMIIWLFLIVIF